MPKPAKIKKPKSFMFTTKHHSFSGVLGCILAIISVTVFVGSIYHAFVNRGKSDYAMAGMGLFSAILNMIGALCGITAMSERDIHKWVPVASIVMNLVLLFLWMVLVIKGA